MSDFPQTRETLLVRVGDPSDSDAWQEFVSIYRPVVYRLARHRGLQDADALDLVQQVLISISRNIGNWEQDPARGRFRTWLSTVTRNAIVDAFRRLRPDAASGDSSLLKQLSGYPATEVSQAELISEYKRQVFRQAAKAIRPDFEERTWQAFWRSTVEHLPVEEVAKQSGCSVGAVYSARARVMKRLREEVQNHVPFHDTM